MPVPVCLFVATFDPTVERAQNGESDGRSSSVARFIITAKLHARRAGSSWPPRPHQHANPSRPRMWRIAQRGYKPLFEARGTGATLGRTPLLSVALPGHGLSAPRCFQRETMAFSRGLGGSMKHWILEASNILPGTKKALHLCKALIFLDFLAPRPGLEPGTYGLTVGGSDRAAGRANAHFRGSGLPILSSRSLRFPPG